MLKTCIIIITWIGAKKIKVFMIGLENELFTKIRLIVKKKAVRERICLAGRPIVPRRFDKKSEEKGAMPKEQRVGTGPSSW